MTEHLDICFKEINGRKLYFDLFLPEAENPPLIMWIHGGGWSGGDRKSPILKRQVERGYALASIDYRLSGEAVFPANIIDCKSALAWLRQNTGKYGYNAKKIAAAGDSAGGHLAALMGTSVGHAEWEPENADCSVSAVVDYYGPCCLSRDWVSASQPGSYEEMMLGVSVKSPMGLERGAGANPATYITGNEPPFLILHGDKDDVVPYSQSVYLRNALEAAGSAVAMHKVHGGGHGFNNAVVDNVVDEFLDYYLKLY